MTPPLPDRIAAAIKTLVAEGPLLTVFPERALAKDMLEAAIAEVVAERDAQRECFNLLAQRCDAAERKVDSLIDQRDAATKRADGLDEKWARAIAEALHTTFKPGADNSVEVWAAHVRREHEAHTRKDEMFRKACEQRDAMRTDLAAAQAKLAAIGDWCHQAGRNLVPHPGCSDSFGDGIRRAQQTIATILRSAEPPSIAAAEQGGA